MVRTQIQLSEKQSRAVKERAKQHRMSVAEYVRRALDRSLGEESTPRREELIERAIAAAGCGHSGLGDISAKHDEYLDEAYGQ